MAIKDLKARDGNVDIEIEIVEKSDVREFQKFGKAGRVCNAKGKDETGTITLTLWNEDIDKVNVGDKVHITNGYVSEWQGELQLGTGKFGQMEVVGKAEGGAAAPAESAPAEPAAVEEEPLNIEEEKIE
jgi:replication factor A1|tara:strand:- start:876 stop:1262 length:387 start_codon:yes stop_codon:yes gene_type:complete